MSTRQSHAFELSTQNKVRVCALRRQRREQLEQAARTHHRDPLFQLHALLARRHRLLRAASGALTLLPAEPRLGLLGDVELGLLARLALALRMQRAELFHHRFAHCRAGRGLCPERRVREAGGRHQRADDVGNVRVLAGTGLHADELLHHRANLGRREEAERGQRHALGPPQPREEEEEPAPIVGCCDLEHRPAAAPTIDSGDAPARKGLQLRLEHRGDGSGRRTSGCRRLVVDICRLALLLGGWILVIVVMVAATATVIAAAAIATGGTSARAAAMLFATPILLLFIVRLFALLLFTFLLALLLLSFLLALLLLTLLFLLAVFFHGFFIALPAALFTALLAAFHRPRLWARQPQRAQQRLARLCRTIGRQCHRHRLDGNEGEDAHARVIERLKRSELALGHKPGRDARVSQRQRSSRCHATARRTPLKEAVEGAARAPSEHRRVEQFLEVRLQ